MYDTSALPRTRRWRPLSLGALLLVIGLSANAPAEGPLVERWRVPTELHSSVNVVVGRVDGHSLLCVQGATEQDGVSRAAVVALDVTGTVVWQTAHGEPDVNSIPGAYLQWIPGQGGEPPLVVYSHVPRESELPGGAVALNAHTGEPLHTVTNTTHFGNNNSIVADLDRDGTIEFLYADQRTLTNYTPPDWTPDWTCDAGVLFCWSLPALADVNGDGRDEIVFGSEYNNEDHSSSVVAIDRTGHVVWRSDGHEEDLGSTPVFVADVDGDGTDELLKVGLDLEHRRNQEWNHVHIFDKTGQLKKRFPFGSTGVALGNMDADRALEAVGLTNMRDGGNTGGRAIRCIDLASGHVEWTTPVARAYLDTNSPVMADFDGDGELEAVVGTGNPAGYARLPNSEPWGDLYVVDGKGAIVQHLELPGWPVNTAFCDLDDDGLSELVVVIDGTPSWLAVYSTKAPARRPDWPTPFGSPQRDGALAANTPAGRQVQVRELKPIRGHGGKTGNCCADGRNYALVVGLQGMRPPLFTSAKSMPYPCGS